MLLLLTAFQAEYNAIVSILKKDHLERFRHGIFWSEGSYKGVKVVIGMTGVGMVNCARSLQYLFDFYGEDKFEGVIYLGIAGGVGEETPIGTIYAPKKWFHHALQLWVEPCYDPPSFLATPKVEDGYKSSVNQKLGSCQENRFLLYNQSIDKYKKSNYHYTYRVDRTLECIAKETNRRNKHKINLGGVGASGNTFVYDSSYITYLKNLQPKLQVVDMETQAAAQVCQYYRMPFIAFRIVSDNPPTHQNEEKPTDLEGVEMMKPLVDYLKRYLIKYQCINQSNFLRKSGKIF